jgi:hypothetical protein
MQVWNVTKQQLAQALKVVTEQYSKNVCWNREPEPVGRSFRLTIRVHTGYGQGAKRSARGRRTASACWHAHRDFMRALFELAPNARLKTSLADYRGRDDFEAKYESTGWVSPGSIMAPQQLQDSCDCFR